MALDFQQTDTAGDCPQGAYCGSFSGSPLSGGLTKQCPVGGTAGTVAVATGFAGSVTDARGVHLTLPVDAAVTWDAGNWTIRLNVTTANMNLTWETAYICRVDSACANQATIGSATALAISLGTTGVKSTTISGAAQTPTAGDDVVIVLGFANSAMTAQTFQATPDQLISSPFTAAATPKSLVFDHAPLRVHLAM